MAKASSEWIGKPQMSAMCNRIIRKVKIEVISKLFGWICMAMTAGQDFGVTWGR